MAVAITGEAVRSCFGDGDRTFAALLAGDTGVAPLRHVDPDRVNVAYAYQIAEPGPEKRLRAGGWLTSCVADALAQAGVDPARQRVLAIVGTGLRELRTVELSDVDGAAPPTERLHFGPALRDAAPGVPVVWTLANACSAGGHALALAQDLVELGAADAVVVGATDTMTASMLAMIGRVADERTRMLRPFDADRTGVLLGEGAVALVVEPAAGALAPLARVRGTGLSCDAHHETAPDAGGIRRAMDDAFERAGLKPADVDLVLAHGSGTALNDPTEAAVLRELYAAGTGRPVVTAIKGAVGHTSGGATLLSVAVAVRALRTGLVPPVVGLRRPLPDADGLTFALEAMRIDPEVAQVNGFGFGGVNAVTLLERIAQEPT